jgi:hypothetical protein
LKIPYGVSDFKDLKKGDYAYVDKTPFIASLEEHCVFASFFRPRRFGKSLLISMLEYYYDYKYADQFDELFGDTWIGTHPTPLRNSFGVLKIDFSGVEPNPDKLYETFSKVVINALRFF